jgi:PTH1 family peptidyl-tRNA hydrolase
MPTTYNGLVVGLGNPGPRYEGNRHNIGFMVVDAVLKEVDAKSYRRREDLADTEQYVLHAVSLPRVKGDFLLLKPMTYMNLSGLAVARVCKDYGVPPRQTVVVHDELDLPLGKAKLKLGGGAAGHNGVSSIMDELGTADFYRMRLGVGRPEQSWMVKEYVLEDFAGEEAEIAARVVAKARDTLPILFGQGLARAQQTLHPFDGRPTD